MNHMNHSGSFFRSFGLKPRATRRYTTTLVCLETDCGHVWTASRISNPCPRCASRQIIPVACWSACRSAAAGRAKFKGQRGAIPTLSTLNSQLSIRHSPLSIAPRPRRDASGAA